MRDNTFPCLVGQQFVQSHFVEWGDTHSRDVVCCVHGLTRNARDFDTLAREISAHSRVASLDIVGRGDSGWLVDPTHYHYASYSQQVGNWFANLNAHRVYWVGTSMGGILGMMLAAAIDSPIEKLVISDVGPIIPEQALRDIAHYVGKAPVFASLADVEHYLRKIHSGFGALTDEQWHHLARHSACEEEGTFRLKYDPAIGNTFAEISGAIDMTPVWEQVRCPVLVLRGADSPLISEELALQMDARENVEVITLTGIGHAPMMMSDEQIQLVSRFLFK